MKGEITGYIDVAQVTLYAFWVFFFGLIFWLRREDRREGYPLESDPTGKVKDRGFLLLPRPKTFRLRNGETVTVPNAKRDQRPVAARRVGNWPGAPSVPTGNPLVDGVGPAAWAERSDRPDQTWDNKNKIVPTRADSHYTVASGDPDPRGMTVFGTDNKPAGTVDRPLGRPRRARDPLPGGRQRPAGRRQASRADEPRQDPGQRLRRPQRQGEVDPGVAVRRRAAHQEPRFSDLPRRGPHHGVFRRRPPLRNACADGAAHLMEDHDDFAFEPVPGLPEKLPQGETMLWQGSPQWYALAVSAFHIRKIAVYFGLILAVKWIAAWGNGPSSRACSGGPPDWWRSAPWRSASCACMAWLYARGTIYTLTSKRFVFRSGSPCR